MTKIKLKKSEDGDLTIRFPNVATIRVTDKKQIQKLVKYLIDEFLTPEGETFMSMLKQDRVKW